MGDPCGNVNVEADSLGDVDEWATALLVPGARARGYEIWLGDKRLASTGTAFRSSRNTALRKKRRRGKQLAGFVVREAEKARRGPLSWLQRFVQGVFA
jgi:hypothetical protein